VRARDGYQCVICGKKDEELRKDTKRGLHVHRIIPGSRYSPLGCVTLCHDCHRAQHDGQYDIPEGAVRIPHCYYLDLEDFMALDGQPAVLVFQRLFERYVERRKERLAHRSTQ
jgi:hypothetical protein